MAKQRTRHQTPTRYRQARDDAKIGKTAKNAEKLLGLPEGSVKIVSPSGRKVRTDSDVGKLRAKWAKD